MVHRQLVTWLSVFTLLLTACQTTAPLPTLSPLLTRQPTVASRATVSTWTPAPLISHTPTTTATVTPPHTPTMFPTLTATHTLTPTPTLTFTPLPCREPNGYMVAERMFSPTLQASIDMRVYLPPCYNDRTQPLPVIYLAHGMLQDESAWTDIGAPLTAATMIGNNELIPFIIVMPSEKDLSTPFGYVLANELVPYIDLHYRTIKDRRYRALGGLSRGASWAMFTVLRYPSIFGKLGMHSIGEFNQDDFKTWLHAIPNGLMPQIYVDIGKSDGARSGSEWLDKTLREEKIPHEFHLNDGDHNRAYWSANVKDYLRWYTATWKTN